MEPTTIDLTGLYIAVIGVGIGMVAVLLAITTLIIYTIREEQKHHKERFDDYANYWSDRLKDHMGYVDHKFVDIIDRIKRLEDEVWERKGGYNADNRGTIKGN